MVAYKDSEGGRTNLGTVKSHVAFVSLIVRIDGLLNIFDDENP